MNNFIYLSYKGVLRKMNPFYFNSTTNSNVPNKNSDNKTANKTDNKTVNNSANDKKTPFEESYIKLFVELDNYRMKKEKEIYQNQIIEINDLYLTITNDANKYKFKDGNLGGNLGENSVYKLKIKTIGIILDNNNINEYIISFEKYHDHTKISPISIYKFDYFENNPEEKKKFKDKLIMELFPHFKFFMIDDVTFKLINTDNEEDVKEVINVHPKKNVIDVGRGLNSGYKTGGKKSRKVRKSRKARKVRKVRKSRKVRK